MKKNKDEIEFFEKKDVDEQATFGNICRQIFWSLVAMVAIYIFMWSLAIIFN